MEQTTRISSLVPPASDPWGRALRRGAVAYVLSRLFAVMGAAIAVAAQAVWSRLNEEEPINGLTGLVQVFDSWDGHWYLDVVREGYPHHIMHSFRCTHDLFITLTMSFLADPSPSRSPST